MADYQNFIHGGVEYPLPAGGSGIGGSGASFLRDADPALFFMLEFYAAVIRRHVGPRFLAECAAVNADQISEVVAETLPLDPEEFLTDSHIRFPLLAATRQRSMFEYNGWKKTSVDEYIVTYVLPPLGPGEAERLMPALRAVAAVIDNRTDEGMDPSYTPTGSTPGALVWALAGVARADVKSVEYGGFRPSPEVFFPAVTLHVELKEVSDPAADQFDLMAGADVAVDIADGVTDTVVADVVDSSVTT